MEELIKNWEPSVIENGQLVFIETKQLHVYIWGKFRKYRWYHRFFFKPVEIGMLKKVDMSGFEEGE